jgi:hypothetical protein
VPSPATLSCPEMARPHSRGVRRVVSCISRPEGHAHACATSRGGGDTCRVVDDEARDAQVHSEEQRPPERRPAFLRNTSELIEGAVVVGAILVVASHGSSDTRLVATALGVLAIYWLTHAYAHALSATLSQRKRLFGLLFTAIRHDSTILVGGFPALFVFAVALAFGAEFGSAVLAGLWATILFLTGVGLVAGYRIGLRGWPLGLEGLLAGSAGAFMLLLKTLLH